ncbi:DUF6907 domain-containing protein [Streptomyces sclerotialus]|uniref:DUF6907 domain-containing protein n=1 Tax=Streptomyces sclerotialus TaxID=1957 RepID=UPI0004C97AB7
MTDDMLDPVTLAVRPVVCPVWCRRVHTAAEAGGREGIMHLAEPVSWNISAQPERSFPQLLFHIMCEEGTSGRTSPVVEVGVIEAEGRMPYSCDARTAGELDRIVGELERVLETLRGWRAALPGGVSVS